MHVPLPMPRLLSLIVRKPISVVYDQVTLKPVCAGTEDGHRLEPFWIYTKEYTIIAVKSLGADKPEL